MDIKENLQDILENHNGGAFLFIGSGFSRRYLGLEDWAGLLSKFTTDVKPFDYYRTSAGGDLAKTASLLAEDFHGKWWELDKYSKHREEFKSELKDKSSALRLEISNYLSSLDLTNPSYLNDEKLVNEVNLLSQLNIDGIITTNWDLFLENIFPNYQKFVGQSELLFSNLLESCEIYKIHGCASKPNSLVLTDNDYADFESKNAYLASKLITIFVEHPIIFIGYSLNDENIKNILTSIVKCLDTDNIDRLRRNLIFVQRLKHGDIEQITESTINFAIGNDNPSLPITLIKTDNFADIYEAILVSHRRRLPIKLIRHLKEKIYELDFSDSPKEKIHVIDAEEIENYDEVEFVIGLGIKNKLGISEVGYASIETADIMDDVIGKKVGNYEPRKLVENVIFPKLNSATRYLPVYKYLSALNIKSQRDYENFKSSYGINLDKLINISVNDLKNKNMKLSFERGNYQSIKDLINSSEVRDKDILFFIPFLNWSNPTQHELEELRNYLITNRDSYLSENSVENSLHKTAYIKLVVLYDKLQFGWK